MRALGEWTTAYNLPHSSGDPLQDAISERLARLFPDDFASDLDKDAIWVDLPPGLLQRGELNLLHEPTIFASPSYDPTVNIWAQLAYASVLARLLAFLSERGVPPTQCHPEQVNAVAAMTTFNVPLQYQGRGRDATGLCDPNYVRWQRDMPRSLFTSPKRNASVLFRLNKASQFDQTTFNSAEEGRIYFETRLARLPVSFSHACVRPGSVNSLYLSVARRSIYNEITWHDLSDGICDVWCTRPRDVPQVASLCQSVKGKSLRVSNSALELIESLCSWHANCALDGTCRWQDNMPTRYPRRAMVCWTGLVRDRRREKIYQQFRDALRKVITPEQAMPPSTMRWAWMHASSSKDSRTTLYADWRAALAQHFYRPVFEKF